MLKSTKIIILIAIIILIGWVGFEYYTNVKLIKIDLPADIGRSGVTIIKDENVNLRGIVIENNKERIPVDGNGFLVIRTDDRKTINISYGGGEAECQNTEAEQTGLGTIIGTTVEVFGKAISGTNISTCESKDYYIKTIGILI